MRSVTTEAVRGDWDELVQFARLLFRLGAQFSLCGNLRDALQVRWPCLPKVGRQLFRI